MLKDDIIRHEKLPEMRHMRLVEVNLCHPQVSQQFPPACYPPTLSATERDNSTDVRTLEEKGNSKQQTERLCQY